MQFQFYDEHADGARRVGSAYGYAARNVGPNDEIGFYVDLDNEQASLGWVDFSIPELRQMLAEAEELAEKELTGNGAGCDCANCGCYAPLADEQELAGDFNSMAVAAKPTPPGFTPLELLESAEECLNAGYTAQAKFFVGMAKRDLLS